MEDTKIKSVDADATLVDRLQHLAAEQGRAIGAVVNEAFDSYLDGQAQDDAEWDREAMESWEEYQRTGLHLTNEEVMAWLDRLAKGEDVEPPPCHT